MVGFVALISLGIMAVFGAVTYALWGAYKRHTSSGLKIVTGILMAITGLVALASTVCGVLVLSS